MAKCDWCLEECDELIDRDGGKICFECDAYFSNEAAQEILEFQESLEQEQEGDTMGSFGWYVEVFCGYNHNFSYRSSAPFPLTAREVIREARVLASYLRYYKGKDRPYPKIFVFAPDANNDSGQLRREYGNIDPLAERGWPGIVRTVTTIEPPLNVWRVASPLIANVTVGLKRLSQVERQVRGSRD